MQVGKQDFIIDLLFFHRGLSCLVAIELKIPHERPSIGVLPCATKDNEVVEYALSRTLSPALVAEYQIALPPKAVLQEKLHELYAQLAPEEPPSETGVKRERVRTRKRQKGARS